MKLRRETSDWRAALADIIDNAEYECGLHLPDDPAYDEFADELLERVCARLDRDGIEYEWAHQQTVGVDVIVQRATPRELEAFQNALEQCRNDMEYDIRQYIGRQLELETEE